MVQTQIQLTEEQITALQDLAERRRLSLVELLQQAVEKLLRSSQAESDSEARQRALSVIGKFHAAPSDLSQRHDDYLDEAFAA